MTDKTVAGSATQALIRSIDARIPCSLDELPEEIMVPENPVCVFVSGSLVAGWGHATSDVDLYVVTDRPVTIPEPISMLNLNLSSEQIPIATAHGPDGQRYDIEYWTTHQVQIMLDAVAYGAKRRPWLTKDDVDCFYRLDVGTAITGTAWLHRAQEQLAASALPRVLAAQEFAAVDTNVNDAVGMMEVGDSESAVLAARQALGNAVDGYLAARGSFSPKSKWRHRKLAELSDSPLSLEEYWGFETMRDFDPTDPDVWVTRVLEVCNALIMEVDFS